MWAVNVTIMWAMRVAVGFKCYGMGGLHLCMYTKDERAKAKASRCTCDNKLELELLNRPLY